MEYVKLIDYLDRPEMIRHVDGRDVVGIERFGEDRLSVQFKDSAICRYYDDGRWSIVDEYSRFVLKETEEHKLNLSKAITAVLTYATETASKGQPTLSTAAYDELIRLRHNLRK